MSAFCKPVETVVGVRHTVENKKGESLLSKNDMKAWGWGTDTNWVMEKWWMIKMRGTGSYGSMGVSTQALLGREWFLLLNAFWIRRPQEPIRRWKLFSWILLIPRMLHVSMLSRFGHIQLLVTLWTVARQAPLSMGFSRQEYWSRLPCPPPGDLPDLGIKPTSFTAPALAGEF